MGTLSGRPSQVVETMPRREIDLCYIEKCRWRDASARMIESKDSKYKCFWISKELGTGSVGVLLAKKWRDKAFHVKHVSDRLMMIKIIVDEVVVSVLSVYAPQTGLTIAEKELFYDSLQNLLQTTDDSEMLFICGDFNSHNGKAALGYEGIHGGYGFGKCNIHCERALEFAVGNNLVVGNLKFVKKDNHLIMYQSCGCLSQVDYILLQCNKFHLVRDIKVIPREECVTQHCLLICNVKVKISKSTEKKFVPKLRA